MTSQASLHKGISGAILNSHNDDSISEMTSHMMRNSRLVPLEIATNRTRHRRAFLLRLVLVLISPFISPVLSRPGINHIGIETDIRRGELGPGRIAPPRPLSLCRCRLRTSSRPHGLHSPDATIRKADLDAPRMVSTSQHGGNGPRDCATGWLVGF